jgi:hypothetical protein
MPYGLRNLQRRLYLKKYEPYIHSLGPSTAPHTILASILTRLLRRTVIAEHKTSTEQANSPILLSRIDTRYDSRNRVEVSDITCKYLHPEASL